MKNKVINDLFGKDLISAMSDLLKKFVNLEYDKDSIYKELNGINESVRVGMYLMALENNNDDVAYKIKEANKELNEERRELFLTFLEKGKVDKFLVMLGKSDKISLMEDLGVNVDVKKRALLSKEQKRYYDIINKSILKDQVDDTRNGIDRFIKYKKDEEKKA